MKFHILHLLHQIHHLSNSCLGNTQLYIFYATARHLESGINRESEWELETTYVYAPNHMYHFSKMN